MISLARRDGARKDLLEICTHTPSTSHAIDLYTEFEWSDLCGEVAKLRLAFPSAVTTSTDGSANASDDTSVVQTGGHGGEPDTVGSTASMLTAATGATEVANDAEMRALTAPFTTVLTSVDLPATPEPANYAQAQEFRKVAGVEAPGIETLGEVQNRRESKGI